MRAEHVQLLAKYSEDMTGDQILGTFILERFTPLIDLIRKCFSIYVPYVGVGC